LLSPEERASRKKAAALNYYYRHHKRNKASARERSKTPERLSASARYKRENPEKRNEIQARRRATKLRATPKWANGDHIAGMYELCALFRKIGLDMHVDHIVPLKSKRVRGLHVEHNLQLLIGSNNTSKGNRWWPNMTEE
jgi:5-methylcytosine-specific restriction endonuclease McrA